ncbi:hypothetical protein HX860_02890 [Marine Group I thaumarchaeote]|uniref:PEFG-CTERM sorting domain-containing protein n=1 Tax=Marine Group I thaumarchaeote TaxID=2511932 RepID=A0A7K4MSC5_9ARCH|nr:MAG: hypothetical protein DSN69_02125 [Nitrosopumilus sp. YT1]NMI82272.1 hypothetical protein [Candidatus Nitrosopumilus sp. MTA1]NWJ20004.1 hypothetical protein [Marine Group I thaumarchaeote]NWJ27915.1 hypothetical protein [Marine Group I thaumarchaeote]NWJ56389.1 hypothetical protein [Marine Group I thaumarchaeote]
MKIIIFGFIVLLFSIGMIVPSFAHTTVEVDQYEIEIGWGIEPPVVGIRNDIILKITESGETEGTYTGVTSVFKNLEATAMYGGTTKKIDINSDPRPGYYFSPIIPTKTGSYFLDLKGNIHGTPIDVQIPIEDVESTSVLDFPPTSSKGSADVSALKNAISSLQQDVSKLKSGETSTSNGGAAYDFAIFGLSIAAAAIILAIIALIKRK